MNISTHPHKMSSVQFFQHTQAYWDQPFTPSQRCEIRHSHPWITRRNRQSQAFTSINPQKWRKKVNKNHTTTFFCIEKKNKRSLVNQKERLSKMLKAKYKITQLIQIFHTKQFLLIIDNNTTAMTKLTFTANACSKCTTWEQMIPQHIYN